MSNRWLCGLVLVGGVLVAVTACSSSESEEPKVAQDSAEGRSRGAFALDRWLKEAFDSTDGTSISGPDNTVLSVRIRGCDYDHLKALIDGARTFREALRTFKFKSVICASGYEGSRVGDFYWR